MSRFDANLLERALQAIGRPAPAQEGGDDLDLALTLAADLCRRFEGQRLKPYLCPAGVPTIGYGATRYPDGRAVRLTDPAITAADADRALRWSLRNTYLPAVLAACPGLTNARRLAAILDFTFNLGAGNLRASTLRKRINAADWSGAAVELRKWVRGGGRVLPGLVARREAEIALL